MAEAQTASIEKMIPSKVKRNIAAIAFTDLAAITKSPDKAIPFLGILLGFAYIGHTVWVFEGHPSALEAGCREADVLLVDGAMVPHLQGDRAGSPPRRCGARISSSTIARPTRSRKSRSPLLDRRAKNVF